MRRFVKWGSVAVLAALAVLAVWSSAGGPANPNGTGTGQQVRYAQPVPGVGINSRGGTTGAWGAGTVQETRRVAEGVPGVKRAWPVQSGNDMLVGIELDMDAHGDAAGVEKQVASRINSRISAVDNVRVTANTAQVSRIRTISESVVLGRPVGNYTRDIANLWRSAPPQSAGSRLQMP